MYSRSNRRISAPPRPVFLHLLRNRFTPTADVVPTFHADEPHPWHRERPGSGGPGSVPVSGGPSPWSAGRHTCSAQACASNVDAPGKPRGNRDRVSLIQRSPPLMPKAGPVDGFPHPSSPPHRASVRGGDPGSAPKTFVTGEAPARRAGGAPCTIFKVLVREDTYR